MFMGRRPNASVGKTCRYSRSHARRTFHIAVIGVRTKPVKPVR